MKKRPVRAYFYALNIFKNIVFVFYIHIYIKTYSINFKQMRTQILTEFNGRNVLKLLFYIILLLANYKQKKIRRFDKKVNK